MVRELAATAAFSMVLAWPGEVSAADVKAGEALARRWCAVCHVVAADQERKPTVAPAFAEIAKPGFGPAQLLEARKPPHPPIPPSLPEDQAADIAAYIASLAK